MEEQIPNLYDQKKKHSLPNSIFFGSDPANMISIPGTYYLLPFRGLKATYHLFPATYFLLICWTPSSEASRFTRSQVTFPGSEAAGRCVMITPQFLRDFFYQNHTKIIHRTLQNIPFKYTNVFRDVFMQKIYQKKKRFSKLPGIPTPETCTGTCGAWTYWASWILSYFYCLWCLAALINSLTEVTSTFKGVPNGSVTGCQFTIR